jgi:AmmeMemoRadiSam system protein B
MKPISCAAKICFLTICVTVTEVIIAQEIRPIKDNVGFCWNLVQMKRLISYLERAEKCRPSHRKIVAAISPHDDYLYAAKVYYPLYHVFRSKEVVIFGVTHGTVRQQIGDPHSILILDDFKLWHGITNYIEISPLREFIKGKLDPSYYIVSNKAHTLEHSIEAVLPFLQFYNPQVKITPIMVTQMTFGRMDTISERLSDIIADYIKKNHLVIGKDIAFLVSSDANHYGKDFANVPFGEDSRAHKEATEQDKHIAHDYLEGILSRQKIESLTIQLDRVVWCGKYSVPFGLMTASKVTYKCMGKSLTGRLLRYSDSYTESVLPLKGTGMGTTAPASYKHWCGWLSAAYYFTKNSSPFRDKTKIKSEQIEIF